MTNTIIKEFNFKQMSSPRGHAINYQRIYFVFAHYYPPQLEDLSRERRSVQTHAHTITKQSCNRFDNLLQDCSSTKRIDHEQRIKALL